MKDKIAIFSCGNEEYVEQMCSALSISTKNFLAESMNLSINYHKMWICVQYRYVDLRKRTKGFPLSSSNVCRQPGKLLQPQNQPFFPFRRTRGEKQWGHGMGFWPVPS